MEGRCVLICAPNRHDAESLARALSAHGVQNQVCSGGRELADAVGDAAGLILATEEALWTAPEPLAQALRQQPSWSELPVLILAAKRAGPGAGEQLRTRLPEVLRHAIILERPLSVASLLSATSAALRMRARQFEMRDRLTERDTARREVAQKEAQLRLAIDAAEIGLWDVDPVAGTLFWPPRVRAMFGIFTERPVSLADFYSGLHPQDREAVSQAFAQALDPSVRAVYDVEYRTVGHEDKLTRWVAAKGRGLFDDRGVCRRVLGTAIDITARKADELELLNLNVHLEQRVEERTRQLLEAEAALRQSQKMEAVGQLTGGIAHDFNNMLTGVLGALDILRRRIDSGRYDGLERYLDAASVSAQRAAGLTARLLAFARRQTLDPRPTNVNDVVASLEELVARTLPETITLQRRLDAEPPPALVDANQLENAILNLAINARDAMPAGGVLTIHTSTRTVTEERAGALKLAPGRYVVVGVVDTGVGMPPEILDKVFDPFFTTKPIGQGTGLGLSMVYGFVQQSGGQVHIESRPGEGAKVELLLPVANAAAQPMRSLQSGPLQEGGGRSVLLVEDDPSVRLLVHDLLQELGFHPLEAADGLAAAALLQADTPFQLMISDVGLPGINGRQLADAARKSRPALPILLMTGYAEDAVVKADFLGPNMAMISKPFTASDLSDAIAALIAVKTSKEATAPDPLQTAKTPDARRDPV